MIIFIIIIDKKYQTISLNNIILFVDNSGMKIENSAEAGMFCNKTQ